MEVREGELPGVLVVEPNVFRDSRGFFMETYHADRYAQAGINVRFVQDNFSHSARGTLRGLHYQIEHPQAKLVQVVRGEIYDVVVDLCRDSEQFGQWMGIHLSDSNQRQLYVPPGFAHGFYVLSETVDFFYKCSDLYFPEHERTLLWNDPAVGVEWPIEGEPILSDKDRAGIPLASADCYSTSPG